MTAPSHGAYRPDIDGLRAIAVLGVILFHAGNPWVAGGYVGVDVFFVISGYLITGILKRELAAGTFSFARFYEQRARRILPALLVVVAATLAASAAMMFADDARVVGRSAVAVLLFSANFLFWRGAEPRTADYFAYQLEEQPLLHTWSLGVEEQYYLLFPLLLAAIWRASHRWIRLALFAATAGSFMLCAWLTARDGTTAFYLLPTRVWQLLVGGLLAWHAARRAPARRDLHELIALGGLGLVVIPMAQYSSLTPYPGWHAAVPVLGAVLLIRYAPGSTVGRLLAMRPAVFIGLISYSAYLWHQPLFALARYTSLSDDLGAVRASALCVATLILAVVTWRWVETPFRDRTRISRAVLIRASAVCLIGVGVGAALMGFGAGAPRRVPMPAGLLGQAALSLFTDCNHSRQLTRHLGEGCLLDASSSAPPSFLVVGDSHADALFPAFARVSRITGRQGRLLQHMACSPLLRITDVAPTHPGCREMVAQALAMVADPRIDSVFLVSRFDFEYAPRDQLFSQLEKSIAAYGKFGATVYIVKQAPEHLRFNRRVYRRAFLRHRFFGEDVSAVMAQQSVTMAEHRRVRAFVDGVFERFKDDPRVRFVDLEPVLCDNERCHVGTAAGPYYADDDHLNTAGALLVSEAIASRFSSALTLVPSR